MCCYDSKDLPSLQGQKDLPSKIKGTTLPGVWEQYKSLRILNEWSFNSFVILCPRSVGMFGGNEEELLLHHGREGRLEEAQ